MVVWHCTSRFRAEIVIELRFYISLELRVSAKPPWSPCTGSFHFFPRYP